MIWRRFPRGDFAHAIAGLEFLIDDIVTPRWRTAAHMTETDQTAAQSDPQARLRPRPAGLFFFANSRYGIFVATATFMVAVMATLAASYVLTRTLPIMPVVTAIVVLVFGGLTLILHNDLFIKIKPTIIYALFGAVLLGGLLFGKSFLGVVFDSLFHLTDEGWRKLTLRWALFFFALAVLNEIVWRNTSTNVWVDFKVFGFLPLTFVFGALQYPLLKKYAAARRISRHRGGHKAALDARHVVAFESLSSWVRPDPWLAPRVTDYSATTPRAPSRSRA